MSALMLLERELGAIGLEFATREGLLGKRIRNADGHRVAFPLHDLVRLALLEEHYGELRKGPICARMMNVTESVWRQRLRPTYEALRLEIESWNSVANYHLSRRIGRR